MNSHINQLHDNIQVLLSASRDLSEKQRQANIQQSLVVAFLHSFDVDATLQQLINATAAKLAAGSYGELMSNEFLDGLAQLVAWALVESL